MSAAQGHVAELELNVRQRERSGTATAEDREWRSKRWLDAGINAVTSQTDENKLRSIAAQGRRDGQKLVSFLEALMCCYNPSPPPPPTQPSSTSAAAATTAPPESKSADPGPSTKPSPSVDHSSQFDYTPPSPSPPPSPVSDSHESDPPLVTNAPNPPPQLHHPSSRLPFKYRTANLTDADKLLLQEDRGKTLNTVQRHTRCSPGFCLKKKVKRSNNANSVSEHQSPDDSESGEDEAGDGAKKQADNAGNRSGTTKLEEPELSRADGGADGKADSNANDKAESKADSKADSKANAGLKSFSLLLFVEWPAVVIRCLTHASSISHLRRREAALPIWISVSVMRSDTDQFRICQLEAKQYHRVESTRHCGDEAERCLAEPLPATDDGLLASQLRFDDHL